MVVLGFEKWGLHPELREKPSPRFESDEKRARKPEGSGRRSENPDLNDLDRDADVLIPTDEFERAKEAERSETPPWCFGGNPLRRKRNRAGGVLGSRRSHLQIASKPLPML
jgi:hypothetical protein